MSRIRWRTWGLILAGLVPAWYGMMLVHEFGHCLGAWMTGGVVRFVDVPLVGFTRTHVDPNPHPLVVVWAGPVLGSLLPMVLIGVLMLMRFPFQRALQFFAGFCLVANGVYIGVGSFDRIADAGDMLAYGSPIVFLWLFGATTTLLGLMLWHRLGVTR